MARVGEPPVLDAEPGEDEDVLDGIEGADHGRQGDDDALRPL